MSKTVESISVKVHVDVTEIDDAIEKMRVLGDMAKPVYVVYLRGMYRPNDMLEKKKRIEEQLGGVVIVVDGEVDRIEQLSPADRSRLVEMLASELEGE